jgi:Mg2+-importing ATPase
MALADRWQQARQDRPLDAQVRAAAHATLERLGADGFRLLGVAWRKVEPGQDHAAITDESKLTFAGLIAFQDVKREVNLSHLAPFYALEF